MRVIELDKLRPEEELRREIESLDRRIEWLTAERDDLERELRLWRWRKDRIAT